MVEPSKHDIAVAVKFLDCEPSAARHLAQLLAAARAEGRREAIEAAKAIVRNHPSRHQNCEYWRGCCEVMEDEIHALAEPPADGGAA